MFQELSKENEMRDKDIAMLHASVYAKSLRGRLGLHNLLHTNGEEFNQLSNLGE